MRKAKGILGFIVGLALMLQVGTTVAFADDRTVGTVSAAITNATNVHGQLAAQITAAQTLLPLGTLTVGQKANLTNAINAAIAAQAELAARLPAAQNALNAVNTAVSSGNAAQIATAVSLAEQATANLNAAANAAVQANVNINTSIGVSTVSSQTNQTTTSTNTTTTPIVFSVQTLPSVGGSETSRATQNGAQIMQSVLGLQTLPSTSTGSNLPIVALGGVLMSVGVWLLRRTVRRNIG